MHARAGRRAPAGPLLRIRPYRLVGPGRRQLRIAEFRFLLGEELQQGLPSGLVGLILQEQPIVLDILTRDEPVHAGLPKVNVRKK